MNLKSLVIIFAVTILNNLLPIFAYASGSAYAVFKVSYSETNKEVVGGVAGTAFFTSTKNAMTAYHVLNPESFKPANNHKFTKVWLVHENQKPIELSQDQLKYDSKNDATFIEFKKPITTAKFVFSKASNANPLGQIESEGFRANSAGPILTWENQHIQISKVEKLERIKLKGEILRNIKVSLKSNDVNLEETPSLQLSYQPIIGTSGGPVTIAGKLVGFNSFADPQTRNSTWAVRIQ